MDPVVPGPGPLPAGLGDLAEVLFLLLFFVGPVLARILQRARGVEPAGRPLAPPRRTGAGGPAPGPAPQLDETITWKDLLEGRVPGGAAPPPVPVAVPEEMAPAGGPPIGDAPVEEPWGPDPFAFPEQDLVPDRDLAPGPSEEELESHPAPDLLAGRVAGSEISDVLGDPAAEQLALGQEPAASPAPRRRGVAHLRASRADLRRAVVLSEVFGRPLALRRDGGYPGPPPSRS